MILDKVAARRAVAPRRGWPAGFTLLELLIAMSLIGLMLMLLFGGLRLGAKSWDAAEFRATESGDQRLIWVFLQRALMEMKAVYLPGEQGDRQVAFSGNGDALEFVGAMPARLGPGGAYILRIEAPSTESSRSLVLRRWLFHPEVLEGLQSVPRWTPLHERVGEAEPLSEENSENPELYSEHLLVEDIETLEIAYYGTKRGAAAPDWHDDWSESSAMPRLVRIRIQRDQGDWPPLLAALPALSEDTGDRSAARGRR